MVEDWKLAGEFVCQKLRFTFNTATTAHNTDQQQADKQSFHGSTW